jgi:release factor glutamine methyltransferase
MAVVAALGESLDRAAGTLAAAGLAEPRREALRLAADLFGASPGGLVLRRAELFDAGDRIRLEAAVRRRSAGEPAAYVTGIAGFRTLLLTIDGRALIPRPETEGLVDRVLARSRTGVVVDVGTGSGCLALSLSAEGAYRAVTGIERSAEALELARVNQARTRRPVALVRGDLTASLGDGSVDVLVSNPPYVTEVEYVRLDRSVRDYEPRAALVGGRDGMEPTRRLLADGLRAVRPGGWIALELAAERAASAGREAAELHVG